jgi:hypothetical protein
MHRHAQPFLDAVDDPEVRQQLRLFFDAYDSMDRENTHLRLKLQTAGCPYGHASPERGCELGYPGCACMDDLMAMTAWSPEDEDKAAVRLGQRLQATERALENLQQAALGVALTLMSHGDNADAQTLQQAVTRAKVTA